MLLSRHPYSSKHKALERGRRLPAAAYIQLFSHVDACHSAEQYVTLAVQIMSVTNPVVTSYRLTVVTVGLSLTVFAVL